MIWFGVVCTVIDTSYECMEWLSGGSIRTWDARRFEREFCYRAEGKKRDCLGEMK